MRYKEAYEFIDAAMGSAQIAFPVTSSVKNKMFDNNVDALGRRFVRKLKSEVFTAAESTTEYHFTNLDVTNQIYRVQIGDTTLPFVPLSIVTSPSQLNESSYYYEENISLYGDITDMEWGNLGKTSVTFTSNAHGLSKGDYVYLRNIIAKDENGANLATVLALEGVRSKIDSIATNTFAITVAAGSGTITTKGGDFQSDIKKIVLHKGIGTTDDDSTLEVHYYAKPRARNTLNDIIDLPERLVRSAMHYSISDLLNLDGQFKPADAHRQIGAQHEADYLTTSRNREAMMDLLPNPLPDFI